jgi:carboxylesterase type B
MKIKLQKILLILVLTYFKPCQSAFNKCTSQSDESNSKIVTTLNGAIKGECYEISVSYSNGSTITHEVFSWLAIPYAQPPTGTNRFMSPKPVENWTGTKETLKWPISCFQSGVGASIEMNEDCLFLNIFVPNRTYFSDNSVTPVLLYIHGGGFIQGTSADDLWEPSTLAASQDIIVVTINYRLNVFGFLHMADSDASGNAGFLDQTLAMKWVYENIESFGGDKTKITIAGESAGAFSVGYHLFYPGSWQYFRNGIMESGGPIGSSK